MFRRIKIRKSRPDPNRVLLVLAVCVFLIGWATKAEVEGAAQSTKTESEEDVRRDGIKFELMGEIKLDTDVRIEMALGEGRRIAKEDEGEVVFFNKAEEPIGRIEIEKHKGWWVFSDNGRYAGALNYPIFDYDRTEEDSFILHDSLGNEIWSITRETDKGTIFHSRYGKSPDVKISNDGSRVAVLEDFNATKASPDKSFRVSFYGEKGEIVKTITLSHPYCWQAAWSPDGELFVVSVPGKDAHKISKDDVIYAFDKSGNELWKYVSEGLHFIPAQYWDLKTLVVGSNRILQHSNKGILILDRSGKKVNLLELGGKGPCYLKFSPGWKFVFGRYHDGGKVYLFSPEKGTRIWNKSFKYVKTESFSKDGDVVYLLANYEGTHSLVPIDVTSGDILGKVDNVWGNSIVRNKEFIYVGRKEGSVLGIRILVDNE